MIIESIFRAGATAVEVVEDVVSKEVNCCRLLFVSPHILEVSQLVLAAQTRRDSNRSSSSSD